MDKEYEFLQLCISESLSKKEINLFKKAIEFVKEKFDSEKRISGEFITEHNFEIASILIKSKMPSEIVIAGLLYSIQNKVFPSEIQENFSKDVSDLVFGQNQLKVIRERNISSEAEVLRKVILTSLSDSRIIFIKLASKLANLYTVSSLPIKNQKIICQEVLDIYAPLANRFGLEYIKRQLEDEAFKNLNPKKYKEISDFLKESREEREEFVKEFLDNVENLLKEKVKILKIKGRDKHIYSIYKKIINRNIPLQKQKDHFAIRIIVKSLGDCYEALGILHENFEPVEGTLKDYISSPKENGYRSLHTILKHLGKMIEVQIRTQEMDEFDEEGVAAHWKYKGMKSDENFEKKTAWLKSILDLQNSCSDKDECLKAVKINLFEDKIYCYTPKGKAVELPKGCCVLDFAYYIHQEIGNHAIGGKINGEFNALNKKLNSGDVVEIITNKNQRPRRDWLKFVLSGRAINVIKKGISKYESIPSPKRVSVLEKEEDKYDNVVYNNEFPNVRFVLAKCCNPLPEEKIVGIMKMARTFNVHKKECERIKNIENQTIPIFWKETFNRPLLIKVYAEDRSGILADLLHTISREGFIVKEAKAKLINDGFSECSFVIVPRKLEEVVRLIKRVKKVKGVRKVFFE